MLKNTENSIFLSMVKNILPIIKLHPHVFTTDILCYNGYRIDKILPKILASATSNFNNAQCSVLCSSLRS